MAIENISGFGGIVTLVASVTFPSGITITQFADDADPIDMAAIDIAEKAMGANGDMLVWSKAVPIPCVLNIVPNSADDINLSILVENNRVAQGKVSTRDVITLNVAYPDGSTVQLNNGAVMKAMFGKSWASAGRFKSKNYEFAFQGFARS